MADLGNFDAEQVDPAKDFEALPPGKYPAMVTESEEVDNSSGKGSHLKLTLQVTDGQFKGRLLWHRLNLKHENPKTVQIARGELSSICRAVGVLKPRDSSELHNLPMVVRVDVREYEGRTYNDVKGFYPLEGEGAQAAPVSGGKPAPTGTSPASSPAGGGAAPWAKKSAS